jgi:hypothetical protein
MRRLHPVLIGSLAVAVLDGLEPVIFYALRGVRPMRVFQGIAAGLVGRESFNGGIPTMLLGMGLHLVIASVVVTLYWLASRKWTALAERPVPYGILYGLVVYAVMTFVVVPLSAAGSGIRMPAPVMLANGIFAHLFCVGLPTAFAARAAGRQARPHVEIA